MEAYYTLLFMMIAVATAAMQWPRGGDAAEKGPSFPPAFIAFQRNYLFVYTLMMAGDWLQGPYVYALYQYYGYNTGEIGKLFIAGFGSSMVFGTFIGSLADRVGRKKAALLYCATYIGSCVTKHWGAWNVLMLGRFFGGIATSLLFSVFESWIVAEHFSRGYDPAWLSSTFSRAVFFGNGLVAILAGLLANTLVGSFKLGPVAPFDAAIVCLSVGAAVISLTWTENYGQRAKAAPSGESEEEGVAPQQHTFHQQLSTAVNAIYNDPRVGILGAIQSLFEASMYTFVFLWTPALAPDGQNIPYGMIFATFMVSCMFGSSIASKLLARSDTRPERYMQNVFLVAAGLLSTPVIVVIATTGMLIAPPKGGGMSLLGQIQYVAFNGFEICVGIFWPSLMKMRAQYVPENVRSTVLNMFRIPLNLFVCIILYNVSKFPLGLMFAMCASFLLTAASLQRKLELLTMGTAAAAAAEAAAVKKVPSAVEMEALPGSVHAGQGGAEGVVGAGPGKL